MATKMILLASHGTAGAQAAEKVAIAHAEEQGLRLHHLLVVPDFWKGMMGDDWLNNAVTQIRFGNYVENQLAQETEAELTRIDELVKSAGVHCTHDILIGKPEQCLIKCISENYFDLIIIGAPRPRHITGYRSRMKLEPLVRSLRSPLMIVPYPET